MLQRTKYLRIACGVVGLLGYVLGIFAVKNFIASGQSGGFTISSLSFADGNFTVSAGNWADILCNSTLFVVLIFTVGLSAIGFMLVFPLVYYKMYALGFTSGIFYWLFGARGLLYILCILPIGVIIYFLMIACGGYSIRFSFYILERIFVFRKSQSQYLVPEATVTFSRYMQQGFILIAFSLIMPLYEGFVLPYLLQVL